MRKLRDWIGSPIEWGVWGTKANAWFNELQVWVSTLHWENNDGTVTHDVEEGSTSSRGAVKWVGIHEDYQDGVRYAYHDDEQSIEFEDDGSSAILTLDRDNTDGASAVFGKDVTIRNGVLRLGQSDTWTTYEGLHHQDLADDYMIMGNGTDTFIGGDTNVYIRPAGNTGTDFKFDADGAEFDSWPEGEPVAYPATSSSQGYFYQNWVTYGGSYGNVRVVKSPTGLVTITGLIQRNSSTGTAPSAMFLLPTWARTDRQILTSQMASTSAAHRVDVFTNGQVVTSTTVPTSGWVSVNISFQATTLGP